MEARMKKRLQMIRTHARKETGRERKTHLQKHETEHLCGWNGKHSKQEKETESKVDENDA